LAEIAEHWRELLCLLPGYDPFRDAGDCCFDADAAQLALDFFPEVLKHAKGPMGGQPFELQPWEKCIVANLFGWKRPDGSRRFRTLFLYVGKKNGKSSFAAGLMLLSMCLDDEPGAEFYSAAASRDQAAIIFAHVAGMVRQDKDLKRRFKVYGGASGTGHRAITDEMRGMAYKCLAADANTADGCNPHFVVVDELHRHHDGELASVLERSTASRRQPLVVFTTTADYDRESVCNTRLDYAKGVRDGKIKDAAFLPAIYEASVEDDWTSPETWAKANPNLGVTLPVEYFERQVKICKEQPSELSEFLRLHCNVRTRAQTQWLSLDVWRSACEGVDADAWRKETLEAMQGRACYAGLDLGVSWDFTALALWFPPLADEQGIMVPFFWLPADGRWQRDRSNANHYEDWIRRGLVKATPGTSCDHGTVKADTLALAETYNVQTLGADPWNAVQLLQELSGEGINVVQFRQGFASMNAPSKEFERLVAKRAIDHGANPVLDWMVSSCEVQTDPAGNIKPVKPGRNSHLKIDGVVAAIMALGLSMAAPTVEANVYETQDVEWIDL
jgi:phage terminase large subunit-like protein